MQVFLSNPSDETDRFNSVGNERAGVFAQISRLTSKLVTNFVINVFTATKINTLYSSKLQLLIYK